MLKTKETIKKGIMQLLVRAAPENRRAVINLLPAAKRALDPGYVPDARSVPLHSWRCLLTLLAQTAAMQTDADAFLRVSNELLMIGDKLVPPAEALRQSAELLMHNFHAQLYVCRMRDKDGNWRVTSASTDDGSPVPMFAPALEEGLLRHPVMRAVAQSHEQFIVSNNLHSIEKGGESFDCFGYRTGYRSRLAFILREHKNVTPFGLVMLYTRQEFGFEQFDERFLSRCARLINLVVGRRIALARDTLKKAAGAMAHYGNNALNTMRAHAEYCGDLVEILDENLTKATRLSRQIRAELPPTTRPGHMADDLEKALTRMDLTELAGHLGGVLQGVKRMTRIIKSLQKSVDRPRLLKYVQGVDVLKLDDDKNPNDES